MLISSLEVFATTFMLLSHSLGKKRATLPVHEEREQTTVMTPHLGILGARSSRKHEMPRLRVPRVRTVDISVEERTE